MQDGWYCVGLLFDSQSENCWGVIASILCCHPPPLPLPCSSSSLLKQLMLTKQLTFCCTHAYDFSNTRAKTNVWRVYRLALVSFDEVVRKKVYFSTRLFHFPFTVGVSEAS